MSNTVLEQLKGSLVQKKKSLTEWVNRASPQERRLRVGPAGERQMADHLDSLNTAIKKAEENTLGLCEVCDDYVEASRLEMDYTACVCIEHLTGAERTRLENDLELSQKVQRALLPHEVPHIRGLEIAAFSQPAHIVGGDYFDFVRMQEGSHALVIADVMGKGMAASLLMASLQASLRIIAPEASEPRDIAARLNQIFCNNIRLTKFVTLFIGRYNEKTGLLTYCNAGHNPPLLSRRDGSLEPLLPTAAAIGLVERAEFMQRDLTLRDGDTLLMYTDGVVESWNARKELFGQERLEAHLRESSVLSSQALVQSLRSRLQTFTGSTACSDDTTIIGVRVTRGNPQ